MKDYTEIQVTKKITTAITCNKCGKSTKISHDGWECGEFQSFTLSFGYDSMYDEQQWKFDLCESCLTEFVKSFKHSPSIYEV